MNHCDTVTLSDNLPEVCLIETSKVLSKQLFDTVLLDSTLLDINHTVPDFLTPQQFQWFFIPMQKKQKNEDFWICSKISTAVNFKVLWCFLVCYIVFS